MLLFSISSLIAFFGYVVLLTSIKELSPGYLLGVTIDLPLVVTLIAAVYIRRAPVAVILSFIGSMVIGEYANIPSLYKIHSALAQVFVCLAVSRITAHVRKISLSSCYSSVLTLYAPFGVQVIEWRWKDKAERTIDRISRVLDRVSIIIIPLCMALGFAVSPNFFVFTVIGYSLVWLAFMGIVATPIMAFECAARFIFSLSRSPTKGAE
jgi:hypothetical protein